MLTSLPISIFIQTNGAQYHVVHVCACVYCGRLNAATHFAASVDNTRRATHILFIANFHYMVRGQASSKNPKTGSGLRTGLRQPARVTATEISQLNSAHVTTPLPLMRLRVLFCRFGNRNMCNYNICEWNSSYHSFKNPPPPTSSSSSSRSQG